MNYSNAHDYEDDSDASEVNYHIQIRTMNRLLTSQEQAAVQRIVQDALNIIAVKIQFAVRSQSLAMIFASRVSSSNGRTDMLPEKENSYDGGNG